MKEQEIIKQALAGFLRNAGIKAAFSKKQKTDGVDGVISFRFNDRYYRFYAEVRNELRQHQLAAIEAFSKKYKNEFIIIVPGISPAVKAVLKKQKIAYIEGNGNAFIKRDGLLLLIDTNEALPVEKVKPNRAFTKTGLQVVFRFLTDNRSINFTYRELVDLTGSGLGNINHVLSGLSEMGFVIRKNAKEKQLSKKEELIRRWVIGYEERLKPALFIGTFRFLKPEKMNDWRTIKFNAKTCWGGEPAAAIVMNKLNPAELTIYTAEEIPALMKNYQLVPDVNGNIKVFRKFWKEENTGSLTAPALLIYTDLVISDDQRNIEAAQQLYETIIQD